MLFGVDEEDEEAAVEIPFLIASRAECEELDAVEIPEGKDRVFVIDPGAAAAAAPTPEVLRGVERVTALDLLLATRFMRRKKKRLCECVVVWAPKIEQKNNNTAHHQQSTKLSTKSPWQCKM